ncbi:MAG TPA: DUF1801 domain-containing protein [Thermoanaerobaculia bacterium]|nr:DUF1801 domain-containing protein [Thermoanaerobaculia bacterium]
MAEPKTRPTGESVAAFIDRLEPEARRDDCRTLVQLFEKVTGKPATMWGPAIVGFGSYRMKYANGKEADWPIAGFSPRKSDLTLYLGGMEDDLLARLGKHKRSPGMCLYIKRLADVDVEVLEELITRSAAV